MSIDRIRHAGLREKVMSADQAAEFVKDGMMLAVTGFTGAVILRRYQLPSPTKQKRHMPKATSSASAW